MIFALLKAPLAGVVITLIVAAIIARLEQTETFLLIYKANIGGLAFFWSWPVFLAGTGLAFAVFWMTE